MNPSWQAYKEAGFAGLVALLFGVVIYNQIASYNKLSDAREADVAVARKEREQYAKESWDQTQKMLDRAEKNDRDARDREDKQRDKMWQFVSYLKDWLVQLGAHFKATFPMPPVPKKDGQ